MAPVLFASLLALGMGVIAAAGGAQAALDCTHMNLQNLKLPDPADPGANGWASTGNALKGKPPNPAGAIPELAADDQNEGVARGTAQHFTRMVQAGTNNADCFYLRRNFLDDAGMPAGTANGVLCFDKTNCSVCAWDKTTGVGDADPKDTLISNMKKPGDLGFQNCSACHVMGLAMPMKALYDQAKDSALMNMCVSKGGPEWVGAPTGWATQDVNNVVGVGGCGGAGCHDDGFLKPQANQTLWCNFAGQAFQVGGAMANQGRAKCRKLMKAVGCPEDPCAAGVPTMAKWALAGLAAFLGAAGSAALLRRTQPPRTA